MAAITRGRGSRVRQETSSSLTRGTGGRVSQERTATSIASHTLTGAVAFSMSVAAAFDLDREHILAGAVILTLTPAATFDLDREHTLAGAVTLTMVPGAAMDADTTHTLTGAVALSLVPAAADLIYTPFSVPAESTAGIDTSIRNAHVEHYRPRWKTKTPKRRLPVVVVLPLAAVIESDRHDLEDLLDFMSQAA